MRLCLRRYARKSDLIKIPTSLILVSVLLFSCEAKQTALEGIWNSSKTKTEMNLPVTSHRYEELEDHIGSMSYRFAGNKTTFTPTGNLNGEEKWLKFELKNSAGDEIVISISGHGVKETLKFRVVGNCLVKAYEEYGFSEYFCKS